MNVLINSDELLTPWIKDFAINQVKQQGLKVQWTQTSRYLKECRKEFKKLGLITVDFNQVNYLLTKDLAEFRNDINTAYKIAFKEHKSNVSKNLSLNKVNDQILIDKYLADETPAFAKIIAPQLSNDLHWILDKKNADWDKPFFIRNIINNESLITECLDKNLNFWFVDTGYTNFLHEKQKVWHRLVRNHIHHGAITRRYPTDRMHLLSDLPTKWRRKGSTILVIENSPSHYSMRGTTLDEWKRTITESIRAVSDRPIEFRSKNMDRKTRESVYTLLKENKDYYCVISDSSAAAVEAIWTGTPVITLEQHISNSVSRQSIEQLNNLYRGEIEQWFAMVSYSQFTFKELCDGTAVSIIKEFGNV